MFQSGMLSPYLKTESNFSNILRISLPFSSVNIGSFFPAGDSCAVIGSCKFRDTELLPGFNSINKYLLTTIHLGMITKTRNVGCIFVRDVIRIFNHLTRMS